MVFAYEAHLVELVKTLPDRTWDKERKLWKVPRSCARAAVEALRQMADRERPLLMRGAERSVQGVEQRCGHGDV